MKALACGACGDIQALQRDWRTCTCGVTSARWVDPYAGTAIFRDPGRAERRFCFIIGLHNGVLSPALGGELRMFADFREAAEAATDAPNSVFDKTRGNSWAVVVGVGATGDVSWEDNSDA